MESTVPDEVEHIPMSVCAPGGTGGSRTSTSPFVSNRLMAIENKSTDKGTKRPTEGNGYSGMHEATVLERMRLFTSNNSSRSSTSPRVEEKSKRVLREDWIKEGTPIKPAVEVAVPEIAYHGRIPIPKKLSISQARTELPIILAHVKVSERASNFNILDEASSLKKNASCKEELPSVIRNIRAPTERSSSIPLMDSITPPPKNVQTIEEVPQLCRDVRVSERMTNINPAEQNQEIVPKNVPPSDRKLLPSGSGTAVETSLALTPNRYSHKRLGAEQSFGWNKVNYLSVSISLFLSLPLTHSLSI
jgi:hypothetical protein